MLHIDVMDGHFVPNLTMGPDLCRDLRKAFPESFLDVHLMVTNPEQLVGPFQEAGADLLTFHLEPSEAGWRSRTGAGGGPTGGGYDPVTLARTIRDSGMACGVAINPDTASDRAIALLDHVDLVLVMSVYPGFSGQSFIESSLETARTIRSEMGSEHRLEMDGGIGPRTAALCREAGCDVLAAASAIFRASPAERPRIIASLRGEG
jgi:ribulose-phosphate 3-epimerase